MARLGRVDGEEREREREGSRAGVTVKGKIGREVEEVDRVVAAAAAAVVVIVVIVIVHARRIVIGSNPRSSEVVDRIVRQSSSSDGASHAQGERGRGSSDLGRATTRDRPGGIGGREQRKKIAAIVSRFVAALPFSS